MLLHIVVRLDGKPTPALFRVQGGMGVTGFVAGDRIATAIVDVLDSADLVEEYCTRKERQRIFPWDHQLPDGRWVSGSRRDWLAKK